MTNYTTQDVSDGELETSNEAIESSSAWKDKNSNSFSINGGVPDIGSSTAGASFSGANAQLEPGKYIFYSNEYFQEIQVSTTDLQEPTMPLSDGFITAVKGLPASYTGQSSTNPAHKTSLTMARLLQLRSLQVAAGSRTSRLRARLTGRRILTRAVLVRG